MHHGGHRKAVCTMVGAGSGVVQGVICGYVYVILIWIWDEGKFVYSAANYSIDSNMKW